jgi:ADP-ribose pyrophosphatase
MKGWQRLSAQYILKSRWLSIRVQAYRDSTGKVVDDFYIAERPDFVVVVPQTPEGKLILVS